MLRTSGLTELSYNNEQLEAWKSSCNSWRLLKLFDVFSSGLVEDGETLVGGEVGWQVESHEQPSDYSSACCLSCAA